MKHTQHPLLNKRLGQYTKDGRIHPHVDVLGNEYTNLNQNSRKLENGYFVVLPLFKNDAVNAAIDEACDELSKQISKAPSNPVSVSKAKSDDAK